jgi:5-methylcytosine-specific restriction endonuclease McrA
MIPLRRLEEPRVLAESRERWRDKYLEERAKSPKKRPPHAQYAHKDIVATLEAMSFHKCFYCEQSTKQGKPEVDHYIEVAERPDRAFEWSNLYLSCNGCNDKLPNTSIPAADCLDPCDASAPPAEHLTYDEEFIRPRADSTRGRRTIQKYRLDRDDLDHKRVRQLRLFDKTISSIKSAMLVEQRRSMNDNEKELLRRFRQPDQPFSLMFEVYTRDLAL